MSVLKGTRYFYDYGVSDLLEYNLKRWLEYGLVELGAFTNIQFSLPTSGYTNLKRVHDPRFTDGQVWEGIGPSWIWESGIVPVNNLPAPVIASGVTVNGTFHATSATSGAYAHKINYRDGMVVFNTALTGTPSVKCEYGIRDVGVYGCDSEQWRTIVNHYIEKFDILEDLSPSGMAQILKTNRVLLPSIFLEATSRSSDPLQLGGGDINVFEVNYHIFSDKAFSSKRLSDVISDQYDKIVVLFNQNDLSGPYKSDGTLASGALTYPQVADRLGPYYWTDGYCKEATGGVKNSATDVYRAECSHVIEVSRYTITYQ